MSKNLLFAVLFIAISLGFAKAQSPNITYTTPQTAYIGKALTPITPVNTGGVIPNRLYPQNIFLNTASNYFGSVRDLVRTSNGDVFVCGETQIYRFKADGTYSVFAGNGTFATVDGVGTSASFQEMNGIDKDANDNIYVTETNMLDGANCKIRKITPAGVVTTFASGLSSPLGIAYAGNGTFYITTYTGKIMKINADGTNTFIAGQGSGKADGVGANASFYTPNALVVDASGNLFVNDSNNSLIRKVTPDGTVTTFAGSSYGTADGVGTAAKFFTPSDLVLDSKGNLIVADGSGVIRKITPGAMVTTIAQAPYYDSQNRNTGGGYYPNRLTIDDKDNIMSVTSSGVYTINTTGYSITPALPAGLTFNPDGSISGTPTALSAAQTYTIKAQNADGISTTTINLGVVIPTDAPVITSFTPTTSYQSGLITITGNYFTGTTAVTIGGKPVQSFYVASPTSITAYVALNATSGDVTVTNPYGTATATGFTFVPPPTVTSFSPTVGGSGTVVTINGTGFTGATGAAFGGYYASITVVSPTQIQATVGSFGNSGSVSVTTPAGTGSLAGFTYVSQPQVYSTSPTSAAPGSTITISGNNFTSISSVKFGNVEAASFNVVSSTQITAVVPAGGGNGVTVTNPGGASTYSYFTTIPPPTISTVAPLKAGKGSSIFINGTNLTGAQVTIGGAAATVTYNSSSQLNATVGANTVSGDIVVTTAAGSVTFPGFVLVATPVITSFSPQSGKAGDVITITGTDLNDATYVTFGNVSAAFTVVSPTTIQATLNYGASGSVAVTTAGGTASLAGFTHTGPSVASFSPTTASAGQSVVIQGTNFTGATAVSFGGVAATSFVVNSSTQITAVVGLGKTGAVSVVTPQGTGALNGFTHPGPTITSLSPAYAGPLSTSPVTISGTNFSGVTGVSFGGVPAASFNVVSVNTITATPAANTVSGDVVVTTGAGTDKRTGFTWVQPPTITSFTPTSQKTNSSVTITGTNFSGVTSVKFGGVAAYTFSVLSSTSIYAFVGAGASGAITVSTVGGTTSADGFTYAGPVIQSISPRSAAAGQTVTITGTNLDQIQTVQFGGTNAASFNIVSPTTITAVLGNGTTGNVTVTGTNGTGTITGFTFIYQPAIYNITPTQGGPGTVISISGSNLSTVSSVQFGGVPATITSVTDNLVKATVGSGATGKVSVTTLAGTAQLDGFTWFPTPTITSVSPLTASATTTVTITGTNFTGVNIVKFGTGYGTFTVVSPTQITAKPAYGGSGDITVTSPGGTATFSGFNFISAPVITNFSTSGEGQGATVTLTGNYFDNATDVQFGGVSATSFKVNSSTSITATVGAGATGLISVITPGGTGTIAGFVYNKPPVITSFSPSAGAIGTTVTITGNYFNTTSASNLVYFGPVKAQVTSATATQLQVVVPAGANGPINVLNIDKGLSCVSNLPFYVTNNKGFTGFANKFKITFGLASPNFASNYKVQDFDDDGQPDLLISKGDSLFILLHGADPVLSRSSYTKKIVVATGRTSVAMAVGDLDGDGKADILYSFGSSLAMLKNTTANGTVSFSQTINESINFIQDNFVLRDIDMDGLPDMVLVTGGVFRNTTRNGVISFGPITFLANTDASSNTSFAMTDVDGDGKPDPMYGSSYSGISVFQNNTVPGSINSSLMPGFYLPVGYYDAGILTAVDLDGDGKVDIAASGLSNNQYIVARNTAVRGTIGTSSFAAPLYLSAGNSFYAGMVPGDLDGDGKPDLIGSTGVDVSYAKNLSTSGSISFNSPTPVITAASTYYITRTTIGDMDGDGRADLITIDGGTNSILIYNNGPAATPQITSVTPLTAGTGTTVTITGKYLDATSGVSFGSKAATSFQVTAPETVTAVVGAGESGTITLQNPDGNATFAGFTYIPPPTITTATAATDGTGVVTITGTNLSTATAVAIGNTPAVSFTVISDTNIKAYFGTVSGTLTVTTTGGSATQTGVSVVAPQLPGITAISTTAGITGTTVTLTGVNFIGVTAVKFGGTDAASFTVNSATSITAVVGAGASGNVTVTTATGTATISGFVYTLALPANNYQLTITSATCKGSANGSVAITATKALNYTATITGNGLNASFNFTSTQTISNLAAGTYNICFTVAGQANYQQCFTIVITEPKDLSVYSTIDPGHSTVDLMLNGADQYNISLNGKVFSTSAGTITLPLANGINKLMVTTDKLCQGVVEQTINNTGKIAPYPDPFDNEINLNLGLVNQENVAVEIRSASDGRLVFSKTYTNRSGVLQLNASNFKSGLYALKLVINGTATIFKIIKK